MVLHHLIVSEYCFPLWSSYIGKKTYLFQIGEHLSVISGFREFYVICFKWVLKEATNPGFSATHCKWVLRVHTIVWFSATIANGFSKHQRILDFLRLITNGLSKKWTNHGLSAAYCKWILLKKPINHGFSSTYCKWVLKKPTYEYGFM